MQTNSRAVAGFESFGVVGTVHVEVYTGCTGGVQGSEEARAIALALPGLGVVAPVTVIPDRYGDRAGPERQAGADYGGGIAWGARVKRGPRSPRACRRPRAPGNSSALTVRDSPGDMLLRVPVRRCNRAERVELALSKVSPYSCPEFPCLNGA